MRLPLMEILLITVVGGNNFTVLLKHCSFFIIGGKFHLCDSHLDLELMVFRQRDAGHDLDGKLVLLGCEVNSSCVDFCDIDVTYQKHGLFCYLCIDLHKNSAFPE